MNRLSGAALVFLLHASFCVPTHIRAATLQAVPATHAIPTSMTVWESTKAEHVYGFPDMKSNKKGVLRLSTDTLTFTAKSGNTSIQRSSVTAVSAGNQRVELWGIKGRLLRMAIPDGGGMAAATFMHHQVDMLTVEFNDTRGGAHSAVFFLPANEAAHALESFAVAPAQPREVSNTSCPNGPVEPKSVLVSSPDWDEAEVPAAYRSLVYEHVIDRLRRTKDIGHVYRAGEVNAQTACPQYTVHIAIATFKAGSSVKRAFLGPIGMFVGTTQMKFDVSFTDASGKLNTNEQIAATIRGENESTSVADHVAKNIAKHYTAVLKNADKSSSAKKTDKPVS